MSDPVIHSSSWTGPFETSDPLKNTSASVGHPWIPTDTERAEWAKPTLPLPSEIQRWARLVGGVFLSPLLLLASWVFARTVLADAFQVDHRAWLILWGLAMIGIGVRECHAGKPEDPTVRSRLLVLSLSATCAFACWYPYAALSSYAGARASQPERTYELYHSCGRNCGYYVHQRPDGTTVEGVWVGDAVPYSTTCALAQRLEGANGFTWVRVLGRSPPPAHEIAWPIRREDCFSDKPLASLKG